MFADEILRQVSASAAVLAAGVLFCCWRRPWRKELAAALLASGWALPAAVLAGLVSNRFGLGLAGHPLLLGSPPGILLCRTLACGALAALLPFRMRLSVLYGLVLAVDLLSWSLTGAAVPFGPAQWGMEAASVAFCLFPAQCFARWTVADQHVAPRALLHTLFHAGLLLGVLPGLIVSLGGGSWNAAFQRSWARNNLYLQLLLVPALLLISALQEFVQRGRGTPMPEDAPKRLVTSGIYAYVANPMQIGKFGILAGWGLFWWNGWFLAMAAAGLLYSVCIASPREDRALAERFGERWTAYRRAVRRWWPRWRPYCAAAEAGPDTAAGPARLYLDLDCGPCSELAEWLERRRPVGLSIHPLRAGPGAASERMKYDPGDGSQSKEGVTALARALEHVHLGWAFCAWMLRLPGIASLAQVIADAFTDSRPAICQASPAAKSVQAVSGE